MNIKQLCETMFFIFGIQIRLWVKLAGRCFLQTHLPTILQAP